MPEYAAAQAAGEGSEQDVLSDNWRRLEPFIRSLPAKERYDKADLLVPQTLLSQAGSVEIYYAPHHEYVNRSARIVIVGLTPGWQQMELAYRTVRSALNQGLSAEAACREAKLTARFAGSMRTNLIGMLDALAIAARFGIPDAAALFDRDRTLLHTAAVLPQPVFAGGVNYTGHRPPLLPGTMLHGLAVESLRAELAAFGSALVIPLGRTVEQICRRLADDGVIREDRCLWGFPHPSGANGHRHRQFEEAKAGMSRTLDALDH